MTPLLTVEEAAELCRVPVKTMYSWRTTGYGPPGVRLGVHLRYREEDVEAWIAARVTSGSRPPAA